MPKISAAVGPTYPNDPTREPDEPTEATQPEVERDDQEPAYADPALTPDENDTDRDGQGGDEKAKPADPKKTAASRR